MAQKLVNLKRNLLIIIMTNMLLLKSYYSITTTTQLLLLLYYYSITKADFDAKLSSLNRKITTNKSKHLLVENDLKKLKTFDSSYFIGKSHYEEDGT